MKAKMITILFMSATSFTNAQNLQWANNIGASSSYDGANCITTDVNDEICVSGSFNGTTDLNPGGVPVPMVSFGGGDAFLAKYNQSGTMIWGKHFGGSGASDFIFSVKTDASANIYIGGYFDSPTFDADPSPLVHNLIGNSYEAFVVKLDPNGSFIWAQSFGSSGSDGAYCLDIDANGNLLVGGIFSGTVDFDPSASTANLTATSGQNGYILRLDPNGNFVSAAQQGDGIQAIKADSNGEVNVIGYFAGTKDLDPGAGISNTTAQGTINSYACRLTATNDLIWASPLLGTGQIWAKDLALEDNGDIVVVGYFSSNIQMNPAAPDSIDNTMGYHDVFIIRFNKTDGSFLWGKQLGGIDDDEPRSISIDEHGYIYYAATFWYTIDADPGIGVNNLTSSGYIDYYISRLNGNGDFMWANSFGNLNADYAQDIHYSGSQELLICGQFQNTIDFDPTANVDTLNAGSYSNGFVAKYNSCSSYQTTVVDTGCGEYQYYGSNGLDTIIMSGTYVDTLFSLATGCDSTVTLHITITNIETSLTQNAGTFTALQNGATYQWFTCPSQVIIPGETNQSFTPTLNGDYGVIINYNGCTSNSTCHNISDVGLENNSQMLVNVFPNPTTQYLNINSQSEIKQINIYDLSGKTVFMNKTSQKNQLQIDVAGFAEGLYTIEISDGVNSIHKKFIKN